MREIKFRGKNPLTKQWEYGFLITVDLSGLGIFKNESSNQTAIISGNAYYEPSEGIGGFKLVEPETVGQFTGLLDKNGKEIYEGDIVRDQWNSYTPIYQNAIYMAYNAEKINDLYESTQFNIIWRNGCEVIGNIHDNPELLEVSNA